MGQLQTWTRDEICDLQEELEDNILDPHRPRAQPHAVYWIYGPCDLILYIGCSRNPRNRLASHKCMQEDAWWPMVERHEIRWFPNHREAIRAETAELRRHRPICNPVIPEADGKHITSTKGRRPVKSVWAQVSEIARQHGMTVMDVIQAEVVGYVRRHHGHAPTEGETA